MRPELLLRTTRSPHHAGAGEPPRARRRRPGLYVLGLLAGLLLPATGAGALSVDGGYTFAFPMPDLFLELEDTSFQVGGTEPFFFGLQVFPISGGSVEDAGAVFPYTGAFEHEGTSITFERGGNRIDFLDPVVDTAALGLFADVEIFENGTLVETRSNRRLFNLAPLLPEIAFPLPGLGLPDSLPAVVDFFGDDVLLDFLEASVSFETDALLSEVLFGSPLDLAGQSAALLGVAAHVSSVPEPAAGALALAGLAAAAGAARRRRAGTRA